MGGNRKNSHGVLLMGSNYDVYIYIYRERDYIYVYIVYNLYIICYKCLRMEFDYNV